MTVEAVAAATPFPMAPTKERFRELYASRTQLHGLQTDVHRKRMTVEAVAVAALKTMAPAMAAFGDLHR